MTSWIGGLARRGLPVLQLGARRARGKKSPFQVTLSLTNRCNFRCEYCNIPLQERAEMTTAEWCAAIDELAAGGMGRASLMGGEPLLRRDAGEIIAHLKRRGVHASMNTNGWLVPSRIEDVAALDLCCVTLDGPELLHDRQRHPGSYARVIAAIDALLGRGVKVVTMTVVTPDGAENVAHVLDVARRFGIKAFFQIEHHADFDVTLAVAPRLTDGRVRALAQRLIDLKASGQPVGNSRSILEAQRDRRYLGACADCYAGQYYGYVLSDGTMAPCLFTQGQVQRGNGREHGFVKAFQELAPPEGRGCSCVPTHEVNRILGLDLGVLFDAVNLTLRTPRPAP